MRALRHYGVNQPETWRCAASFINRNLKGAKPGDLPIVFPTNLEMAINLKTAKALGLTVPQSLLVRADEVIEGGEHNDGTSRGRCANVMPHKFTIGQAVEYSAPRGLYAPRGIYLVTAKLPERDGEFEYHIKHSSELHERIAKESELHGARRGLQLGCWLAFFGKGIQMPPWLELARRNRIIVTKISDKDDNEG